MRILVTCLVLVTACAPSQARIVRNLGLGVLAEGGLVAAGAYATRDPGEGVRDGTKPAWPILATGLAAVIVGNLIGFGDEATPNR